MTEKDIIIGQQYKNSQYPKTVYLGTGHVDSEVESYKEMVIIKSADGFTNGRKCVLSSKNPTFWQGFSPVTPRKRKK